MALKNILEAMELQARAEIVRLKAQAETEASAIVAKAEQEAKATKERYLASAVGRLHGERWRKLNRAKLAAIREVAAARERLIEGVFAAAQKQLAGLRESHEYPECLNRLAGEIVNGFGPKFRVSVDARDETLMRRIAAEMKIEAEISGGLSTAGGLEASTPDGRVTITNTVESRLKLSQRQLRAKIVALLLSENATWKATTVMPMRASER